MTSNRLLICVLMVLIAVSSVSPAPVVQGRGPTTPCRPLASLAGEDRTDTPPETRAVPYCSPTAPVDCEWATLYMEDATVRAHEAESYLIVVARLGDGELSRRLNAQRMKSVRAFLGRSRLKSVVAEGERVNGYGRLEIYVGGKLLFVLPLRRNKDVDFFSCRFA